MAHHTPHSSAGSLEEQLEFSREFLGRLARSLVRDADVAADLVQETMAAALVQRPAVTSTRGWLAAVLRRKAVKHQERDHLRRFTHRAAAVEERVESHAASIDARLDAAHVLTLRLKALPVEQRQAVVLRYSEDLSPPEIAERLGLPVGTVKTRIKRGLARLRADMDRAYGSDGTGWLARAALLVPGTGWPGAALTQEVARPAAWGGLAWGAAVALASGGLGLLALLNTSPAVHGPGDHLARDVGATVEGDSELAQETTVAPVSARKPVLLEQDVSETEVELAANVAPAETVLPSRRAGVREPLTLSMNIPEGMARSLLKLELRDGGNTALAGRASFSGAGTPAREVEFRGKRGNHSLSLWVPAATRVQMKASLDGFEAVSISLTTAAAGETMGHVVDLVPLADSTEITLELPVLPGGGLRPDGELWYVWLEYDDQRENEMPLHSVLSERGTLPLGRVPSGSCRILGRDSGPLRPDVYMQPQAWSQVFETRVDLQPGAVVAVSAPAVDVGIIRLDVRDPDGVSLPASFYLTRPGDSRKLRPGTKRTHKRSSASRLDGEGPALLWPFRWPPGSMRVHVSLEGYGAASVDAVVVSGAVTEVILALAPL